MPTMRRAYGTSGSRAAVSEVAQSVGGSRMPGIHTRRATFASPAEADIWLRGTRAQRVGDATYREEPHGGCAPAMPDIRLPG